MHVAVGPAVAAADDQRSRERIALLRDRVSVDGRATAYVCERFGCKLPVSQPGELAAQLTGPTA